MKPSTIVTIPFIVVIAYFLSPPVVSRVLHFSGAPLEVYTLMEYPYMPARRLAERWKPYRVIVPFCYQDWNAEKSVFGWYYNYPPNLNEKPFH